MGRVCFRKSTISKVLCNFEIKFLFRNWFTISQFLTGAAQFRNCMSLQIVQNIYMYIRVRVLLKVGLVWVGYCDNSITSSCGIAVPWVGVIMSLLCSKIYLLWYVALLQKLPIMLCCTAQKTTYYAQILFIKWLMYCSLYFPMADWKW